MKLRNEYIKELNQKRGWSQNELARQIDVSKGALSKILNGKRGAGRKVIAGLLRIFDGEKLEALLVMDSTKIKEGVDLV